MDKECYRDIEKIKTIGSTYMAAVGLVPTTGSKVHMQQLHSGFQVVCMPGIRMPQDCSKCISQNTAFSRYSAFIFRTLSRFNPQILCKGLPASVASAYSAFVKFL